MAETIDTTIEEMKITSALKHRTIYMNEDFGNGSCFKLNYYLDRFVKLDQENKAKKLLPITIYIDSFGGSIYDGLSTIGRIVKMKEDGYTIISIVSSYAMSMGSALSQVCSIRKASRYSTFLYHQASGGAHGTTCEMKVSYEEQKRIQNVLKDIMLEFTKLEENKIDAMFNSNLDVYMTPKQALENGIIDEII